MDVQGLAYTAAQGWSRAELPALDSDQTLVLAFGDSEYLDDPEPLEALRRAYPRSVLAGCSSAGEILGPTVSERGLAVAVARFAQTRLAIETLALSASSDSYAAGAALARRLAVRATAAGELRGVLVLSDGLSVNASRLVDGFNDIFQGRVIVTGGLAGDGDRFRRTWVLHHGRPVAGRVSAVGFYGARVHMGHGSRGGWDIFGPERRVTWAEGNVLYELDGRPALRLYKEYLGEMAEGLPATGLRFPLALRADDGDHKRLVRTIIGVDEASESMTFAGDIPMGGLARLMRASFDHLVDGAEAAALMTRNRGADGAATLAVAISCVGRRMVLGARAEDEVEATLDALPAGTLQVGFYSYGELSPYASGVCDLHNQSMTMTTIHER
ncbi:hypothetical protein CKO31_15015 [Thiohalocapsa halophila]|uniref:Histidine kinase n=1 Tax=Thiohalocapsa halophila TaxID=69359 RepID=A0ABS1CJJ5_9GAMM|nr:FIST N-terminal domain-containing protein [Thiohalocapsa halophila]MBK1632024.1 hypothetical protein [Thiohalocapsa halophila]